MISIEPITYRNQHTHPRFRTMECDRCYTKHGPIFEELDDYNWDQAFRYFNDYDRESVAEILAIAEGANDGPSWLLLVKLNDGKFGGLDAWCDYTGWD